MNPFASDITKRIWTAGISDDNQFPNGWQLNQMWADALARPQVTDPVLESSNNFKDPTAKEERKRKNRENARRSREKRKNEVQMLNEELASLQEENQRLRNLVKTNIPEHAQEIIKKCCADHPLHHAAGHQTHGPQQDLICSDFTLIENLIKGQQSFVVTDPAQPDNPIVYASEAFYKLTGYEKEQVLGRNCRFLQGVETDMRAVAKIRTNIEQGRDTSVNLLNYKADGTPFWNQFFIAPLRDKNMKIINYVGVQCEIEEPKNDQRKDKTLNDEQPLKHKSIRIKGPADIGSMGNPKPLISEETGLKQTSSDGLQGSISMNNDPLMEMTVQPLGSEEKRLVDRVVQPIFSSEKSVKIKPTDLPVNRVDWSVLAGVLEEDFKEGLDDFDFDTLTANTSVATSEALEGDDLDNEDSFVSNVSDLFSLNPLEFVTRTCRSELVDALLSAQGDVTDSRFLQALDVLSSIYASKRPDKCPDVTISDFLNGSWVSLSRPAYKGCLGKNDRGDFMYSLGKMSFDMFQPGYLKCSVQHTLNNIRFACNIDETPAVAPWSLRRELALLDTENAGKQSVSTSTTLRSYDLEIAITVEPGKADVPSNEEGVSPSSRLRAVQEVHGYMLKDPEVKNRMTVWFTSGKLLPVAPPKSEGSTYGGLDDWKAVFGTHRKKTWSESFKNMGAKLFLGAELPQGMEADGSMSYTLHRPYGGHGSSYVDILYLDKDLYITRGNYGTLHVGVRSSLFAPEPVSIPPSTYSHKDAKHSSTSTTLANAGTKTNTPLQVISEENHVESDKVSHVEPPQKVKSMDVNGCDVTQQEGSKGERVGVKRKCPPVVSSQNGMRDISGIGSEHWKGGLYKALEKDGPECVALELNEVLMNFGLEVVSSRKRVKH